MDTRPGFMTSGGRGDEGHNSLTKGGKHEELNDPDDTRRCEQNLALVDLKD